MTVLGNIIRVEPIKQIDVFWITAGLGCDGDTIAITAATQPSLEDVLLGGIPGIPKVNFQNPFLAYENREEGKLIAIVSPHIAERLVDRMKQNCYGRDSCIIGEVKAEPQGHCGNADGLWRNAHR
jgi:hypothetical protein